MMKISVVVLAASCAVASSAFALQDAEPNNPPHAWLHDAEPNNPPHAWLRDAEPNNPPHFEFMNE